MAEHDYPYLRAWNHMMNANPRWCDLILKKAREDEAPQDAIYNTAGIANRDALGEPGRWVTFQACEREETRTIIERLIAEGVA